MHLAIAFLPHPPIAAFLSAIRVRRLPSNFHDIGTEGIALLAGQHVVHGHLIALRRLIGWFAAGIIRPGGLGLRRFPFAALGRAIDIHEAIGGYLNAGTIDAGHIRDQIGDGQPE
jgi:hypothetical protein